MRAVRLLLLLALMGLLLGGPHMVSARAPDAYGWWWRGNQVPDQLHPYIGDTPHPDEPPSDGMLIEYFGGGNDGVAAIGALEFIVQAGGDVDMTLRAAEGWSFLGANIYACVAASNWNPALNGQWQHRPEYDCEGFQAQGLASADFTSMTWRLTPGALLNPTTYNIVLVPFGGGGFQVAIERPGAGTLSGSKVPEEDSAPEFDPGPPPPAFDDPPAFGFGDPEPLGPEPEPAPEIEPEPETVPTASPELPEPVDDFIERIFAAGTLAAILGGLWFMSARQSGSLSAGAAGGIGRFARPRENPPVRL